MQYWLLKSEPETFSITDLQQMKGQQEHWDGVRNYQARNFMKTMKTGDQGFFYHSNCDVPGIVGIVEVAREAYPDFTAFDPESPYYDPKSTEENPRWFMVDVKFKKQFKATISLKTLKSHPELNGMKLTQKGNRLSVMPITEDEWKTINKLAST